MVLQGTTTAAVSRVSLMAARVSSVHSLARYSPTPFSNAWANTEARGSTTTPVRNSRPRPMRTYRTQAGSVMVRTRARRRISGATGTTPGTALAMPPALARPGLQRVHDQQRGERAHQHHHRQRGGLAVLVLLELGDDQERDDLGLERHVARDEDDRAVLAHRAG